MELTPSERRALLVGGTLVLLGAAARLGLGPGEADYAWRPAAGSPGPRSVATSTTPGGLPVLRDSVERRLGTARRAARPLAPGERLDPNRVDAVELQRLPGVGAVTAAAVVEWRRRHGPFRWRADLRRVPGIGPRTLERIAPHLSLPSAAPGAGDGRDGTRTPKIDLNAADEVELERIPGVGPYLARRIVELRERKGRFRDVEELLEVGGIGPARLEAIRRHAGVR